MPDEQRTANHVIALLRESHEQGVGIAFLPDIDGDGNDTGWTIMYIIEDWPAVERQDGFPGDRLSAAYDLETACAAALKPLKEIGESYARYNARRAQ